VSADQAQSHGLLDLLDTGVVRLDGSGRILLMNSAAEHCLLVSRDRACGRYIGEVADIPGELRDAISHLPEGSQGVRLHELRTAPMTAPFNGPKAMTCCWNCTISSGSGYACGCSSGSCRRECWSC